MISREELDAKLDVMVPETGDSELARFLIGLDGFLEIIQEDERTKAAGLWQGPAISLKRVLLQGYIRGLRGAAEE